MTDYTANLSSLFIDGRRSVDQTALWPLWARAQETLRPDPLFLDPLAVQAVRRLDQLDWAGMIGPPHGFYARRAHTADCLIRDFIDRHPTGFILSLGDGLETQFWRLGAPDYPWFSVDLPSTMARRRALLPEAPTIVEIAASVTDDTWWSRLPQGAPAFVSLAGLLMYLTPADVGTLLRKIAVRLPSAEVFFDTMPPTWRSLSRVPAPVMPLPFRLRPAAVQRYLKRTGGFRLINRHLLTSSAPGQSHRWRRAAAAMLASHCAPALVHAQAPDHS